MLDIEEQGRMIFRGSFDGDETGFEARSSVVEAGKFPTDEKFRASSFDTSFANHKR